MRTTKRVSGFKMFMLIIDGMSDDALTALDGRTPLEAADLPNLRSLAAAAKRGFVKTVHRAPPESLSCILGLLGYGDDIPPGRAAFEALAGGVTLEPGDLAFRCNIVSLSGDGTAIEDFTAGNISDETAAEMLARAEMPSERWELYAGQSYRNILVVRGARVHASEIALYEPHMHQGEPIEAILPSGSGVAPARLSDELRGFMLRSVREAGGKRRMFWLWGASEKPNLPAFADMHGVTGAVVAGLDFMGGLASAAGLSFKRTPGATGYLDTDYSAKASDALAMFETHDFVLVHVNATDEAAHARDAAGKVGALERVDADIIGPVERTLRERYGENFTVIICGDHKTSSRSGLHRDDPVPYMIYRGNTPPATRRADANVFHERMPGARIEANALLKQAFTVQP
jgi:2,3-bisphosphoglycerate-independent phosphoglycerate mutase